MMHFYIMLYEIIDPRSVEVTVNLYKMNRTKNCSAKYMKIGGTNKSFEIHMNLIIVFVEM